jgi:peptidyl-prolyl cis-trans isomerase C
MQRARCAAAERGDAACVAVVVPAARGQVAGDGRGARGTRGPGHAREWLAALSIAVAALGCDGCTSSSPSSTLDPGADAGGRLTPEQASQVLAKVGDRTITLGDYAAALERMDPFERMRYQTEDRRQALLDEMINVELLAREAERRKLDQRPDTIELVRQFQRDELLARLRASLPKPSDLPAAEVSGYYQDHRADFQEPEQRRAAQIVLADQDAARRALREATGASPERWRELVQKYAPAALTDSGDKTAARPPIDVPGDLGFLSAAPDEPHDDVPAAVRTAVFQIAEPGGVYPEPVASGGPSGQWHVVRLVSVREARQRSLAEVDTIIRVRLVQAREAEARAALLARLRQTTTVEVDETALGGVEPPSGAAAGSESAPPAPSGSTTPASAPVPSPAAPVAPASSAPRP